jgi:hypothetical protein
MVGSASKSLDSVVRVVVFTFTAWPRSDYLVKTSQEIGDFGVL